jgi:hypothetical protein
MNWPLMIIFISTIEQANNAQNCLKEKARAENYKIRVI